MNHYDCPQCRSRSTQTFESVYAQNMRHSSGGGGTRNYQSWNQLAMQTAPPEQPHMGCGTFMAICLVTMIATILAVSIVAYLAGNFEITSEPENRAVLIFFSFVLTAGTSFISGLLWASNNVHKQMKDYHQRINEWNHSMLCKRCGCMWVRDEFNINSQFQ